MAKAVRRDAFLYLYPLQSVISCKLKRNTMHGNARYLFIYSRGDIP